MQKIDPIKYSDLISKCGESGSKTGFITAPFPFVLYLNGDKSKPCRNFYGHEMIYPAVYDALKDILEIYGQYFISQNGLDEYGGCFADRPSRGLTRTSAHAWGMAIDYLPSRGRLGSPSLIPYHIVQAFKIRGFIWGGDWERRDGMHFSGVIE